MAEKSNRASLLPSQAVEGGGLLRDVVGTVRNIKFALFDYGGKFQPQPGILCDLELDDEAKTLHENQFWSVGSAKEWVPNSDGSELKYIGQKSVGDGETVPLTRSCNAMIMLAALGNAMGSDLLEEKLGGGKITVLEGLRAHWDRIAAPKREGLTQTEEQKKRDSTILVPDKIISAPWDKAAGKAKGKGAAKKEEAEAESSGGGIDGDTQATILEILSTAGPIAKKSLASAIFKAKMADPNRNAMISKAADDGFLKAGPWKYENGIISPLE